MSRAQRDLALLLCLALLLIGAGLGLRQPWPSDEPRFVLAARQMIESGQWLFPMRGDELYSDKPPSFMWLQALSFLVVREWRVAFLLPSLLSALGSLWLVYDLGRRLWTRRVGLYAAYALLFTLQFTLHAKRAQIDPTLTFLVTLSLYGLLRHLLRGPDWRWFHLGFAAAGLGVITKGVGLIALLVFLPASLARARHWSGVARLDGGRLLLGGLVFLAAIALWLLPMLLAVAASDDPALRAYADDILLHQTAQRYGRSWHHHQPPWYFLGVIALQWLPVALALPWALPAWWRRLRRRDPRYLLLLGWIGAVLLFFSLPAGKRDVYLLPALPMFCLALAPLLPGLLRQRAPRAVLLGFVLLLAALGIGVGTAALLGEPRFETAFEAGRGLAGQGDGPWWLVLAVGTAALGAVLWCRLARAPLALMLACTALWLGYGFVGYPLLDASNSAGALMQRAGRLIGPEAELALVVWKEQNLLQADRPARTFGFRRSPEAQLQAAIQWQAQAPAQRWVLIQETAMGACIARDHSLSVGIANRRAWYLFRADAVAARCR